MCEIYFVCDSCLHLARMAVWVLQVLGCPGSWLTLFVAYRRLKLPSKNFLGLMLLKAAQCCIFFPVGFGSRRMTTDLEIRLRYKREGLTLSSTTFLKLCENWGPRLQRPEPPSSVMLVFILWPLQSCLYSVFDLDWWADFCTGNLTFRQFKWRSFFIHFFKAPIVHPLF